MGELIDQNDQINSRIADEDTTEHVVGTPGKIPTEQVVKLDAGGNATITTQPIPATRKRSQQGKPAVKQSSVSDVVSRMKEKITMLEYIDSLKAPEVPTGLSKDGRELLLGVAKDIDSMKNRLITAIQKS